MIDVLAKVGAHLREHFARAGITTEPDEASVTFLGTERIDVLRFGPDEDGVSHYVSLGCSRHPMFDPTEMVTDALHGPRAEVVVALRGQSPKGLARSLAILAAAPAVEGLILEPDALIDLETPLWDSAPFTAFLLDRSDIDDVRTDGAATAGHGAVRDTDHRHGGGVGAAEGRRRDARGVAAGRGRRVRPAAASRQPN